TVTTVGQRRADSTGLPDGRAARRALGRADYLHAIRALAVGAATALPGHQPEHRQRPEHAGRAARAGVARRDAGAARDLGLLPARRAARRCLVLVVSSLRLLHGALPVAGGRLQQGLEAGGLWRVSV